MKKLMDRCWPWVEKNGGLWGPRAERERRWQALGRRWTLSMRPADGPTGRFGAGWQWKVGVQVGKATVIVNLLVASLRVDPLP